MRLGHDLLAPPARLDTCRRVGAASERAPEPTARRRQDRLVPGRYGCLPGAGEEGGRKIGPNPTDRGEPGTKRHPVTDRQGIPFAELTTAANVNETTVLERLINAISPVSGKVGRPRRRLQKLHADKGYRSRRNQQVLRRRRIQSRIARPGIDSSERLGRHR